MVALQRSMARAGGVVMDGRDIGTVVFPNAQVKFFLDADLTVRAERRLKDLQRAGAAAEPGTIREEVARRDARDRAREVAPLCAAPDAVRIDSTSLDAEAVVRVMLRQVAKTLASG
jgi:cytidylate kinase